MRIFRVVLLLFLGFNVQISFAQDFQNLLESEYADTTSLLQFYVVTNNSIDQYLQEESFRDALNLVEKAMTVSRKFDQTDRLRSYYLKASLIHFRLGNATRSLAYLRMFELELENKTSDEFEKERGIFFDELTRLYQKIEQDSIFNRQLREQQKVSTSREEKLLLWLKILLAILLVSLGTLIYLAVSNKRLLDRIKDGESSPSPLQIDDSKKGIDNDISTNENLSKAWNQIFEEQTKKISDTTLNNQFNHSFYIEEGDNISPLLVFVRKTDNGSTLSGFFSIQSSNDQGNVHLVSLLNSIEEALQSELESTGMIMTLIDQKFSKYLSQSQVQSAPIFAGIFLTNMSEKKISFTGAGISLYVINKNSVSDLKTESAPLGSHVFKNQFYSIDESTIGDGDWIYIFSPGLINQIGGTKNHPLGLKAVLNLLQSISGDTAENQEFMIRKVFREWKGVNTQTDLASIVGIKI